MAEVKGQSNREIAGSPSYLVAPRELIFGGRALFQLRAISLPTRCKLRIPKNVITGDTRRVLTSVVKRKQPRPAKVPKVMVKWGNLMWEGPDSKDVGLEAAII